MNCSNWLDYKRNASKLVQADNRPSQHDTVIYYKGVELSAATTHDANWIILHTLLGEHHITITMIQ